MSEKKQRRGPKAKERHDLSGFLAVEIAELFGFALTTVVQWDCPKESENTFNAGDVVRWYIAKQKEKPSDKIDLEKEKLSLQCEKMTIDIDRMKSEMVSVETHKQILVSRATSLKNYITEFFAKNIHLYSHKSVDQLRPMSKEHVDAMLNHYSSNHK